MKRIFFVLFLFWQIVSYASDKPTVMYFYSPHCKACLKLKEEFLPSIQEKYKNKVNWVNLDIYNDKENLTLLYSVVDKFKKGSQAVTPTTLAGETLLTGSREIENNLENAIDKVLRENATPFNFLKGNLLDIFRKMSVFTVIGSGLIDGINPCAFAVIVFFVSFLAVYGYRKREIFYVGLFYCLSVFLTYLLIGLGLFKFLYNLTEFYLLIRFFYYLVAFFCFSLFILAIYDYIKFKKTKETDELILQLPKFLKKRINFVIGSRLRDKKERGVMSLAVTSFIIGFLVSLLEAVCTGQVYLPTIVFILKNTSLKLKAASYLLLYNLMFILPLIVIFILSLLGFSSEKLNKFLKRNLGNIKLLMALLFLFLGLLIIRIS